MATKKSSELVPVMDKDILAQLNEGFPVEQGMQRIILPRLSMVSQDQTEGKGKAMKVVQEAGTFLVELETEEENEEGKKIWKKEELGSEIEGTILFQRKQLRLYDESTELYTSSPVYDLDDEVLPLFCDKKEVKRGTPVELKAEYQYKDKEGKLKSKLEDNRVLYVLFQSEHDEEPRIYQLSLRGSSMYSYLTYSRTLNKKGINPAAVRTRFSSEAKEKGTIAWNQMTFETIANLSTKEGKDVLQKLGEIKMAIALEKGQYVVRDAESKKADGEMTALVEDSKKASKDF